MTEHKVMEKCELCGGQYQHGPHLYEGERSKLFDMVVCSTCWESNWDGWAPHLEQILLAHLKTKGLPAPERNAKGLFPRG